MVITIHGAAVLVGLLGFCSVVQTQLDVIERNCDPRVAHRYQACPDGYCCVRDEFMPSWVHCKRMAALHEGCTTRDTETNCPCSEGLHCRPNIVSSSGTASLYGKCAVTTTTTTMTTNPPSTTTTTTTTTTTADVSPDSSTAAASSSAASPSATAGHADTTHCPHGHSCEHHGHNDETHGNGHHTPVDPVIG